MNRFASYAALAALATPIALVPAAPAVAGKREVAATLLLGGLVGALVVEEQRREARERAIRAQGADRRRAAPRAGSQRRAAPAARTTRAGPTVSAAERRANRGVQEALNRFGFDAGPVDGVLGPRSRRAVSAMQGFLGWPADGTLDAPERALLLAAAGRAASETLAPAWLAATSPLGARAVLRAEDAAREGGEAAAFAMPAAVRAALLDVAAGDEAAAARALARDGFVQVADLNRDGADDYMLVPARLASDGPCPDEGCETVILVSTPEGHARNDLRLHAPGPRDVLCVGATCMGATPPPVLTAASTAPPAADPPAWLSSPEGRCVAAAPGDGAGDGLALAFCAARKAATDHGVRLAQAAGWLSGEVAARCEALAPMMAPHLAALSTEPMRVVMADVGGLVRRSSLSPEEIATTAAMCLGSGYEAERADRAVAAALLVAATGSTPHAELVAHHLRGGVGVGPRPDLARDWFAAALRALRVGDVPLVPGGADRTMALAQALRAADPGWVDPAGVAAAR